MGCADNTPSADEMMHQNHMRYLGIRKRLGVHVRAFSGDMTGVTDHEIVGSPPLNRKIETEAASSYRKNELVLPACARMPYSLFFSHRVRKGLSDTQPESAP